MHCTCVCVLTEAVCAGEEEEEERRGSGEQQRVTPAGWGGGGTVAGVRHTLMAVAGPMISTSTTLIEVCLATSFHLQHRHLQCAMLYPPVQGCRKQI